MTQKRRNSLKAVMSTLLLTSLVACQQDNSIEELSSKELIPIQLSSGESIIQSRMSGTAFEEADEIGIYVLKQPATLVDSRHVDNMRFTLNKEKEWVPDSPIFYPAGNSISDFIAYYPYKISSVKAEESTLLCEVNSDQSIPTNYAKSDFLVAKHLSISPQKEPITLQFKHQLTEIHIVLLPGNAYDSAEALLAANPIISIKGVNTTATYDLTNGSFSNLTNSKDIIPGGRFVVKDGKVEGKHAIMIPQKIAGNHVWIELSLGGKNYLYTFGENHPLLPATKETYTLTIKKSFTSGNISAAISNWENETNVAGDLIEDGETTPLPPAETGDYTITIPDFTTSSVYKVMKDKEQVAEVCREYLYSEGAINNQAVVIYPFIAGEADLTKGYVAQILNANAGIPVSSSTHGGSVSWNKSTNELTYVPGSTTAASSIAMNGIYEFTPAAPNTGIATTLIADIITHPVSNNVYPIVKVGLQYWIGTN
ncbi:MAG: fimbrillin family protein, partial [Bacteroidaceae bacterium]